MNSGAAIIFLCALIVYCHSLTKAEPNFYNAIEYFSQTINIRYKCGPIGPFQEAPDTQPHPEFAYCELFDSRRVPPNFISSISGIRLYNVRNLLIKCNFGDELFLWGNSLDLSMFAYVKKLTIQSCILESWPENALDAFIDLQELAIITENTFMQPPIISLYLEPHSFMTLRQLTELTLANNNILDFAKGIFCPLNHITSLNLSGNKLQNVLELCFFNPRFFDMDTVFHCIFCRLPVKHLDISYNMIMSIPSHAFSLLSSLNRLILFSNKIHFVGEFAFSHLNQLEYIDLSNNYILQLNGHLFQECFATLRFINFGSNSLSKIPSNLLQNMENLEQLDLSNNYLTNVWLSNDSFKGLIRLLTLNLSANQFTYINASLFETLFSLQVLALGSNKINTIENNTFINLKNLHRLSLELNHLDFISDNAFNGLLGLSELDLSYNQISSIQQHAFKGCNSVRTLNLNKNMLSIVPDAIGELNLLEEISIAGNYITHIDKPVLNGSKLNNINFNHNNISQIGQFAFCNVPQLTSLELSNNRLYNLQTGLFSSNPKLQFLSLQFNLIYHIDFKLIEAFNLSYANVSHNKLTSIDYDELPPALIILDADNNSINSLTNRNNVTTDLRIINLNNNRLSRIGPELIPNSATQILLKNNRIEKIDDNTLMNKQNLAIIDLSYNNLIELNLSSIQIGQHNQMKPKIYLSNNNFLCVCKMAWLKRINTAIQNLYPTIADPELITCHFLDKPFTLPLVNTSVDSFTCPYTNYCPTLCSCCDYACDCEMICPHMCRCFNDDTWTSNIIICSNSTFNFNEPFSMDVTILMLDGVNIGRITPHAFMGRKKLSQLYLNGSRIWEIDQNAFNKGNKLEKLYLQDNKLQKLGGEMRNLIYLQELNVQNNEITSIESDSFRKLRNLRILNLRRNKLRTISFELFNEKPNLRSVSLSDNPWSCECSFKYDMRLWMTKNQEKLDLELFICQNVDGITEYHQLLNDHRFVGLPCALAESYLNTTTITEEKSGHDVYYGRVLTGGLMIMFVLLIVLITRVMARYTVADLYVKIRVLDCCKPFRTLKSISLGESWGSWLSVAQPFDLFIIHFSNRPYNIDKIHQDIIICRPYLKTHVCHKRMYKSAAAEKRIRNIIIRAKSLLIFISQDYKDYDRAAKRMIHKQLSSLVEKNRVNRINLLFVFLDGMKISDLDESAANCVRKFEYMSVEKVPRTNVFDRTTFYSELITKIDRMTNYDHMTSGAHVYNVSRDYEKHKNKKTGNILKRIISGKSSRKSNKCCRMCWKCSTNSDDDSPIRMHYEPNSSNQVQTLYPPHPSTSSGSTSVTVAEINHMSPQPSTSNGLGRTTRNRRIPSNHGENSTSRRQLQRHNDFTRSSESVRVHKPRKKSNGMWTVVFPSCSKSVSQPFKLNENNSSDLTPTPREEFVYDQLVNKPGCSYQRTGVHSKSTINLETDSTSSQQEYVYDERHNEPGTSNQQSKKTQQKRKSPTDSTTSRQECVHNEPINKPGTSNQQSKKPKPRMPSPTYSTTSQQEYDESNNEPGTSNQQSKKPKPRMPSPTYSTTSQQECVYDERNNEPGTSNQQSKKPQQKKKSPDVKYKHEIVIFVPESESDSDEYESKL